MIVFIINYDIYHEKTLVTIKPPRNCSYTMKLYGHVIKPNREFCFFIAIVIGCVRYCMLDKPYRNWVVYWRWTSSGLLWFGLSGIFD